MPLFCFFSHAVKELNILKVLERQSLLFWIITSVALVGVLGFVDYWTGNEFSFSLFYLLPIYLVAWYTNSALGLSISLLSAGAWLIADISAGGNYSHPIIYFWNTLIRLAFFIIVTYLTSKLHESQKVIEALVHTDYITGAANSRYFHQLLEVELNRSNRYKRPFTLVYLDLDNFKQINDRFGHNAGDELIRFIADELKRPLRNTDVVSRLGGDEFAILFPEAGQQEAVVLMSKISNHLTKQLHQKYAMVTFSAGAVTYAAPPSSVRETIRIADELMYSVKNSTKNGVRYSLYTGE